MDLLVVVVDFGLLQGLVLDGGHHGEAAVVLVHSGVA
jgi:hypothetical protein